MPVLGQALYRIVPDSAIKDSYEDAFAPGYDISSGFENPDQVVDDFNAMTYTSYKESAQGAKDYTDDVPLDERLKDAAVPLLVIFGAEDQIYDDPAEALAAFEDVPGRPHGDGRGRRPLAQRRAARGDGEPRARVRGRRRRRGAGAEARVPAGGGTKQEKHKRRNQHVKGQGRHAGQKESTGPGAEREQARRRKPRRRWRPAEPEKGQKPPSDKRPGGNQTD